MTIRQRIFEVIELANNNGKLSRMYDLFMLIIIFASLVPLAFKESSPFFDILEDFTVAVFIIDYALRLSTADYKYKQHSIGSFIKYPFSFMAIIDLLSILPSLTILNDAFRILRMIRAFRVLRIFKALRYSKSISIIVVVLKKAKEPLMAVTILSIAYILTSALIIFNIEPDSFDTFFDAVYWATVSLTTVGYGDIYPVTTFGRMVTMLSSIFGIAIVALPAGIITAGYMSEINKQVDDNNIN